MAVMNSTGPPTKRTPNIYGQTLTSTTTLKKFVSPSSPINQPTSIGEYLLSVKAALPKGVYGYRKLSSGGRKQLRSRPLHSTDAKEH